MGRNDFVAAEESSDPASLISAGDKFYQENNLDAAIAQWEKARTLLQQFSNPNANMLDQELNFKISKASREQSVEETFTQEFRRRFQLVFDGETRSELVWAVQHTLVDAYRKVSQVLDFYPEDPITVIIYTNDQFQRATEKPDWVMGLYDGKVRLRAGELIQSKNKRVLKETELFFLYERTRIIHHEIAHTLLHMKYAGVVPLWLHEGFAQWIEPALPEDAWADLVREQTRSLLSAFTYHDTRYSAELLNACFLSTNAVEVQTGYFLTKQFVIYLEDRYNVAKLKNCLAILSRTEDVGKAFQLAYSRSLDDLFLDFQNELRASKI